MPRKFYLSHSIDIEVPFFDVDPMNIVWHGHYVKYFELARCALLDKIGYGYTVMHQHGYTWPIVKMQCKYIRPARFEQRLRVDVFLTEYESCLQCDYVLCDAVSGEVLHRASTTQAAVHIASGELQWQTPASWRQAVEACLQTKENP
ncbi:MAG: acyl-CoA thioesterase [Neisseria sp.]|nr:acyl-CoA thioesterase [Neisseria sp.]